METSGLQDDIRSHASQRMFVSGFEFLVVYQ